jgi:hypothetical protein
MSKQISEQKFFLTQASVNTYNKQLHSTNDNSNVISTQATPITFLVGFILFWTIFLAMLSKVKMSLTSNKKPFLVSTFNKSLCCKCKYLSHNKYLPCAVNPLVVFTEEAANCQYYCAKGTG